MPHMRNRYIVEKLKKTLAFSPLVGVLGHRQVGKTTLLESFGQSYFTFDDRDTFLSAKKSPEAFIEKLKGSGVVLDECQLVEDLFPALKERVRKNRKPGQFILSGSVRFTSKKMIKDSLTGRIVTLDLLPFLISELYGKPISTFWTKALTVSQFSTDFLRVISSDITSNQIQKYFQTGGLPGVCFIRDDTQRVQRLNSYVETILDRDVRHVVPTTVSYSQMLVLLQFLADQQGTPLNFSEASRECGIGTPTIKKLLYAFESVFLIRSVPLEGDYKGSVYYFEDLCERRNLLRRSIEDFELISHFVLNHIRGELSYALLDQAYNFFQYRTRAGVVVPIGIALGDRILGVVPIEGLQPDRAEVAGGDSFLKKYGASKVLFVGLKATPKILDDRRAVVPLSATV